MMKYIILYLFFYGSICLGQDINYSNIQTITQLYNPALAAANSDLETSLSYRNQGKSTKSNFNVYSASVASTLMPKRRSQQGNLTVGLNVYHEQMQNKFNVTSALISTAYHIYFSENSRLSTGINYGLFSMGSDMSTGQWGSQFDGQRYNPNLPSEEIQAFSNITRFDAGAGLHFAQLSKKIILPIFEIGVAGFHLNQPKLSLYNNNNNRLPMRIVASSSVVIPIGKKGSYIQTSYVFQHQSKFNTNTLGIQAGLQIKSSARTTSSISKINQWFIGAGVAMRFKDALITSVFLQKSNLKLSFAYDFTTSKFQKTNKSMGALEFVLQYNIKSFKISSRY